MIIGIVLGLYVAWGDPRRAGVIVPVMACLWPVFVVLVAAMIWIEIWTTDKTMVS